MIRVKSQDCCNGFITEVSKDEMIKPNGVAIVIENKITFEQTDLGYYKDVKRAKEVMEEIEEHIRQAYVAREFKVSVEDFDSLEHKNSYILNLKENAIYTMPKE